MPKLYETRGPRQCWVHVIYSVLNPPSDTSWSFPGGSAERDGTCQVGDMIIAVDDREVMGEPLSALRNLILGNQGSQGELRNSIPAPAPRALTDSPMIPGAGYTGDFV